MIERRPPRPAEAGERDVDDGALVARLGAGDSGALDELLRCYWPEVFAYARRILGSADAAEDVAQSTFIRLWQRRTKLGPHGSLRFLLLRIARNFALNEDRARRRRSHRRHAPGTATPATSTTPLTSILDAELEEAVERAIAALPERRRQIFVLSRYHGLSYREIADLLDLSPQTVANQMSAALTALRRALADHLT